MNVFAVVLAGGDGMRLREAAEKRFGAPIPKQFCSWDDGPTMVEDTLERASLLTSPRHVLVSAVEAHADQVERCLEGWPTVRRILQPSNRGTGPAVLVPLQHVVATDPAATVVVLPSDHYVSDAFRLAEVIRRVIRIADRETERVFLLGAVPDHAETDYGWIVPGSPGETGWSNVAEFREKPSAGEAEALWARAALWNTSIVVARARPLWSLLAASEWAWSSGVHASGLRRPELHHVYRSLPAFDLSKDVLERSCHGLGVVVLDECDWSDWGTIERIERTLSARKASDPASAAGLYNRDAIENEDE
jgi:mannose-1-phosphate guanylyltransferase